LAYRDETGACPRTVPSMNHRAPDGDREMSAASPRRGIPAKGQAWLAPQPEDSYRPRTGNGLPPVGGTGQSHGVAKDPIPRLLENDWGGTSAIHHWDQEDR